MLSTEEQRVNELFKSDNTHSSPLNCTDVVHVDTITPMKVVGGPRPICIQLANGSHLLPAMVYRPMPFLTRR